MIRIPIHKPPSRIRYEKKHPTVSFRLSKELKKCLKEALEGKSFAEFVKEGIGVREREKASVKDSRTEGYNKGYEEAVKKFGVYTKCTICGNPMIVEEEREKIALSRYFREQGWGHQTCMLSLEIERERRERR